MVTAGWLSSAVRDGRVARDEGGHHAAHGLDAQRQRSDVQEQDVRDLPGEHAALDGGTERDDLVGVDALRRLAAEELGDLALHEGHPRGATHQEHFVDVAGRLLRVAQRLPRRPHRLLDEVRDELLEPRAGDLHLEVLRARGVRGEERQVDLRLERGRELDLRLLRGLLEPLEHHAIT
jgi:hypothetical protein